MRSIEREEVAAIVKDELINEWFDYINKIKFNLMGNACESYCAYEESG